MNEPELNVLLESMRNLVTEFNAKSQLIGIPNFAAFGDLMLGYLDLCEELQRQKVDFAHLPQKCAVHFTNSRINQLNQAVSLIFPGHFLMIGVPPKDLMNAKCPGCGLSMSVTIQHPAYLVRCVTKVCPTQVCSLVVPNLGLVIAINLKIR